jgi:hypothetical protein
MPDQASYFILRYHSHRLWSFPATTTTKGVPHRPPVGAEEMPCSMASTRSCVHALSERDCASMA